MKNCELRGYELNKTPTRHLVRGEVDYRGVTKASCIYMNTTTPDEWHAICSAETRNSIWNILTRLEFSAQKLRTNWKC